MVSPDSNRMSHEKKQKRFMEKNNVQFEKKKREPTNETLELSPVFKQMKNLKS